MAERPKGPRAKSLVTKRSIRLYGHKTSVTLGAPFGLRSIPEFDTLLDEAKKEAPARSLVRIDDVGVATAFWRMTPQD
jgi:hypothetical protein